MTTTVTRNWRLGVCVAVLISSFGLAYVSYSAATQFGDDDNCGPVTNGTSGADTYYMGGGNDCAEMFGGGDFLDGQGGWDYQGVALQGDDGSDQVLGGAGGDNVYGGNANDVSDGQDDGDYVWDHSGVDTLKGGENGDLVSGYDGSADDTVNGGNGVNDYCSWNNGDSVSGCEFRNYD
jgi:hypothetical protein